MKRMVLAALALFAASPAAPALGQDGKLISASRPEELVQAMQEAGYKAEYHRKVGENPWIETELGGWQATIYLYDCDTMSFLRCQTLLLRTGFDRKEPMPLELVNEVVSKQRYMAIYLDSTGDPWADWDIVTGEGIPQAVFLRALEEYGGQVDLLSEKVFAAEHAAEEAAASAAE